MSFEEFKNKLGYPDPSRKPAPAPKSEAEILEEVKGIINGSVYNTRQN